MVALISPKARICWLQGLFYLELFGEVHVVLATSPRFVCGRVCTCRSARAPGVHVLQGCTCSRRARAPGVHVLQACTCSRRACAGVRMQGCTCRGARACVRACVRACMHACMRTRETLCVCVFWLGQRHSEYYLTSTLTSF